MSAATDLTTEDFERQVRPLLGAEDVFDSYGCWVAPADVRCARRRGRRWAAVESRGAWMSRDERLMALINDDLPPARADRLSGLADAGTPIEFAVTATHCELVFVSGAWYSPRFLAGLVAVHGPATHSAESHHAGHPMLVWKRNGSVRAALMPIRRSGVEAQRDLLAEVYTRWSS